MSAQGGFNFVIRHTYLATFGAAKGKISCSSERHFSIRKIGCYVLKGFDMQEIDGFYFDACTVIRISLTGAPVARSTICVGVIASFAGISVVAFEN